MTKKIGDLLYWNFGVVEPGIDLAAKFRVEENGNATIGDWPITIPDDVMEKLNESLTDDVKFSIRKDLESKPGLARHLNYGPAKTVEEPPKRTGMDSLFGDKETKIQKIARIMAGLYGFKTGEEWVNHIHHAIYSNAIGVTQVQLEAIRDHEINHAITTAICKGFRPVQDNWSLELRELFLTPGERYRRDAVKRDMSPYPWKGVLDEIREKGGFRPGESVLLDSMAMLGRQTGKTQLTFDMMRRLEEEALRPTPVPFVIRPISDMHIGEPRTIDEARKALESIWLETKTVMMDTWAEVTRPHRDIETSKGRENWSSRKMSAGDKVEALLHKPTPQPRKELNSKQRAKLKAKRKQSRRK